MRSELTKSKFEIQLEGSNQSFQTQRNAVLEEDTIQGGVSGRHRHSTA